MLQIATVVLFSSNANKKSGNLTTLISEEEPIYCEIPSPCKAPTSSSALQFRGRGGQPLRSSNSRLLPAANQPQPAHSAHQGLGRRAITQLDMSPPKRPTRMIPNSLIDADRATIKVFF